MLEQNVVTLAGQALGDDVVARGRDVRGLPQVLHIGHIVVGTARGVLGRHVQHDLFAGVFHYLGHPINVFGRIVDPTLDELLVALAGGVARQLVQELRPVDGHVVGLGVSGVYAAEVLAGLGNLVALIAGNEVEAQIGRRASSGKAGRAGANDEEVGVEGFDDVALSDFGLCAKPVFRDRCGFGRRGCATSCSEVFLGRSLGRASCQAHGPHGGHGAKAEEVAAVHLHRFFAHSPSCIVDLSCVDERCDWPSQCVIMEELRDRGHRLRAVIREITSLR